MQDRAITGRLNFDSAASAPTRREVLDAMRPFREGETANPSGHYASARHAAEALNEARDTVAEVLGALPEEVIFCSGGTESVNAAIKGVALAQREAGVGAHVVTTAVEHHAVLYSAQWLERFGFEVELLSVDGEGRVDPQDVAAAVRADTVLVSVMYANNEVGTIQPLSAIANAVRAREAQLKRRVPIHTDAVQAATSLSLNVDELDVDLLSLSGHKFGGPQGTGVLYLRRGTPFLELLSGGGQERQRRSGTEDVAGIVGLASALRLAQAERADFDSKTRKLRDHLVRGVRSVLPNAQVNTPTSGALPNLAHLCFDEVEGESIVDALDAMGIETSAGAACTSATWEPSHVLLAMNIPLELAIGSLRLSLWPTHTEADVDRLVAALPVAVERARIASLPAL
jgi:cysteine desulfurase